jgi:apolipoprotein N-acyltransferase
LKAVIAISSTILSGLVLSAAFPSFNLSILAWIALVPFFLVLSTSRPLFGFFLGFIFGVAFYTGIFLWMFDLPKYRVLHHAVLGVYLCPLTGLFGLIFCIIAGRWKTTAALLAVPFLWVVQEYIRSKFFFLSLPWGLLAHSQYQYPIIIQIASLTGTWGISFLIVLVNSALTAVIYRLKGRVKSWQPVYAKTLSNTEGVVLVGTATALLISTLLYGYFKISAPLKGQPLKVSVIQPNIAQKKKWDRKYEQAIMQTYGDLTRQASKEGPALIVWPETATPRSITENFGLYRQVENLAREVGAPILLGSSEREKSQKTQDRSKLKYMNSAFLMRSKKVKEKIQRYDKIRLLPFSEYMPLKETIAWSYLQIPEVGGFVPGKDLVIFKLPAYRFGVTICWENIFPDLVRHFVSNGAQFLVNITNEAWFGKTAAPYQFLSMSVFRAVENRVNVVRSTNTGISCFIDPCGRIIDRIKDTNGSDIFVSGILNKSIILQKSDTIYTRYGDYFIWPCLALSTIFLLIAALKKNRKYG